MSERELRALARVMGLAILTARDRARECRRLRKRISGRRAAEIVDLLNTLQDVPRLLTRFEEWDDDAFCDFLDAYDRKWSRRSGMKLREVYEKALK